MTEEYLHYSFKRKVWGDVFYTVDDQLLKILDFGEHNSNAGPDFLDAKIEFDGKVWVGPIEFHLKASDWYRHKHQNDSAYDNVMVHFVFENDAVVKTRGFQIPTVELKSKIDWNHFYKYEGLIRSSDSILCSNFLARVTPKTINDQKELSVKNRFWEKSLIIVEDIEKFNGDRRKAFVVAAARVFGGKVNRIPFEILVSKLALNWMAKLNYDPIRIDALIFGLAGMVPTNVSDEEYVKVLNMEFNYLTRLFGIRESPNMGWKYSRMHPSGFPDNRLAQFSAFLCQIPSVTQFLKDDWSPNHFYNDMNLKMHPFWKGHYRFGKKARQKRSSRLSLEQKDLLLINAVAPYLYAIGLWEGNKDYCEKAIGILKQLKPENNSVVREWKKAGLTINSAFDSQSLLQLKKEGCNRKKCLFCAIGKSVIKK